MHSKLTIKQSEFSLEMPTANDLSFITELLQNERVMSTQGGVWSPGQIDEFLRFMKQHWIDHGFGHYVIRRGNERIGVASLKLIQVGSTEKYDVGFMVRPEEWGQGIATMVAKRLVELAFINLGVPELSALTLENQKAGMAVLKKLGFRENGNSYTRYAGRDWRVATWSLENNF